MFWRTNSGLFHFTAPSCGRIYLFRTQMWPHPDVVAFICAAPSCGRFICAATSYRRTNSYNVDVSTSLGMGYYENRCDNFFPNSIL